MERKMRSVPQMYLMSETCALIDRNFKINVIFYTKLFLIDNNSIEENAQCGIDIKDPSIPDLKFDLKRNKIEKNQF